MGVLRALMKVLLLAGLGYGIYFVTQLDVSELAPAAQPRQPTGERADLALYDDGEIYLRAKAMRLEVDDDQKVMDALTISDGLLYDDKGRERVTFQAGQLHYEREVGRVALSGGVTLSASEGDVVHTEQLSMVRKEDLLVFPGPLTWTESGNRVRAGSGEANRELERFWLRDGVDAYIEDMDSLALSRSKKTLKKRDVKQEDVLPMSVKADRAIVDEQTHEVIFSAPNDGGVVTLTMKEYTLTAREVTLHTKDKRADIVGEVRLVRPGKKLEEDASDVAQAFAQDDAVVTTTRLIWLYGEKKMFFPADVRVDQPKRSVYAGRGVMDDAADVLELSGSVRYQQLEGPWAHRLEDFEKKDEDTRDILTGPMRMESDEVWYDLEDGGMIAHGHVVAFVKERRMRGARAVYRPEDKLWRMSGDVAYRQDDHQAVFSEIITIQTEDERGRLEGRSRVFLKETDKLRESYEDLSEDSFWK